MVSGLRRRCEGPLARYVDARQQEEAKNAINRELAALKRMFRLWASSDACQSSADARLPAP